MEKGQKNFFNIIQRFNLIFNYACCYNNIYKNYINKYCKSFKILKIILIYLFLLILIYISNKNNNNYFIIIKNFVKDCTNLKRYNKINIFRSKNPYISICIPVYNMEKYLEKTLLSIINQSFKELEIIIVNDNSNDNSKKIIENFQLENSKIRIINHFKNLGVYNSRIDAALNSIGEYILFIDPDDMLLNPYLIEELFNYNLKYNLDMIEFIVYHQEEKNNKIYIPIYHEFNHYHNFKKKIIFQPDLSDIIFYIPNTKNYTSIICRTIWNKIIRKSLLINSILYIDNSFHKIYLITADDTPLNMINFNFANNYSNIKIPGYLYNIRGNSMSRIDKEYNHNLIVAKNFLIYFKFFYKYILDFKKDLNFLLYDLKLTYLYLLIFKKLNSKEYILHTTEFFNVIIKNNISKNFKNFINNIILQLVN